MQKTESNYTMPSMRIEKKIKKNKIKPTKQATVVKKNASAKSLN